MTRYKLPEALGGGEVTECRTVFAIPEGFRAVGLVGSSDSDRWLYLVPVDALTEIKPPTPPEPEPGAYLIGGVLCVRFRDDQTIHRWWVETSGVPGGFVSYSWPDAIGIFTEDVTIRRLVPEMAEVELPWRPSPAWRIPVRIATSHEKVEIKVDGTTLFSAPNTAEAMAGALLSAARKAREAKHD